MNKNLRIFSNCIIITRLHLRIGTDSSKKNANRTHDRSVYAALQGIGGRATNKQDAKSTTLALLASMMQEVQRLPCLRLLKLYSWF